MKYTVFVLFSFFIFNNSFSQKKEPFFKIINKGNGYTATCLKILQHKPNELILLGEDYVALSDSNGTIIWSKSYGDAYNSDMILDSNSILLTQYNYYSGSYFSYLLNIHIEDGSINHTSLYDNVGIGSITQINDTTFALGAENSIIVNKNGHVLSNKNFNFDVDGYITELSNIDINTSKDSNIVMLANFTPEYYALSFLAKIDKDNDTIWSRITKENFQLTVAKTTNDGGVITCGRDNSGWDKISYIIKLNTQGMQEWALSVTSSYVYFNDITELNDGYVLVGRYSSADNGSIIYKISKQGVVMWSRFIAYSSNSMVISNILQKDDTHLLLSGEGFLIESNTNGEFGTCKFIESPVALEPVIDTVLNYNIYNFDSNQTSIKDSTINIDTYLYNISIESKQAFSISTNSYDNTCNGGHNGEVSSFTENCFMPIDYSWSNGKQVRRFFDATAGNYMVTITDGCAETLIDSAVVKEPPFSISIEKQDVTCYGLGNGRATIHAKGNEPPYNFLWSNLQTDSTSIGLFPGHYSVNIIDSYGCIKSTIVTINQPAPIELIGVIKNVTCYNASNGNITLAVVNGTKPYSYSWSNGATTKDLTSISKGFYTITVTDSCENTITKSFTVTEPDSMIVTFDVSKVKCFQGNDGSIAVTIKGGTLPFSYTWPNGATTKKINNLKAGIYSVTISDSCGTVYIDSAEVTEPSKLNAFKSQLNASCFGLGDGQASVIISGGIAPYRFVWNNGLTDSIIAGLFANNYAVNIFDANNCFISSSFTITQPSKLKLTLQSNGASCGNADGIIISSINGGTGTYKYLWSNNDTTQQANHVKTGMYKLLVTDNNTCTTTDSILVDLVIPTPEICMVTVDSDGYNAIAWQKIKTIAIKEYHIYRENKYTSKFELIGIVPNSAKSVYVDFTSKPWQQSDRYEISLIDTCGNESAKSIIHRTIHLGITPSLSNTMLLTWDNYEGIDFINFLIYRGKSKDTLVEIGSVPNNGTQTFTDKIPTALQKEKLYYAVAINLPTSCIPSYKATERGPYTMSRSNVEDAGVIDTTGNNGSGIEDINGESNLFSIYPNPVRDELIVKNNITSSSAAYRDARELIITNSLGQVVLYNSFTRLLVNSSTIKLNIQPLANGMYYLRIDGVVKKFVVNK